MGSFVRACDAASPGARRDVRRVQHEPVHRNSMDYITPMTQANRNTSTSDRLTTVLSYGALVVLGYLVFLIVEPFAAPLAWSAIFAIFFYPLYERLEKRLTPTTGALLSAVGVTLLLILPVLFVLLYAAREAVDASARIHFFLSEGGTLPTAVADWIRQHPPRSIEDIDFVGPLRQRAERIAAYLASSLGL